jgi:hypothetical protein
MVFRIPPPPYIRRYGILEYPPVKYLIVVRLPLVHIAPPEITVATRKIQLFTRVEKTNFNLTLSNCVETITIII